MAVTVERLVATLEARIDKYEKNLQKAYGQTDRQFTRIERRGKAMETRLEAVGSRLGRSFSTFGRGMVAALAAGLTVGKIKQFSDAATSIDNALKVAGLSGENLEKVYGALRDSATRNAAPIETLVELYSRAAMASDNLGASQEDLVKFADNVAKSLRVSGKSATESAGALLQLAQLMSGSVVQAQEYNSLIDGAYPLLQAVAAGLKEAGGDVGKLTQLVKSGQVPTKAFFDAFQAGSVILDQKVASATFTISQAFGNLQTALIDTAREFNHTSGAAENAADNINTVARAVTDFDVSGFIQKISSAKGALENFLSDLGNAQIFTSLNQMLGITDSDGNSLNLETKEAKEKADALERDVKLLQETIAKNTELGFDNTAAIARLGEVQTQLGQLRAQIANMPAFGIGTIDAQSTAGKINDMVPFSPLAPLSQKQVVSLADYDPPKAKGKGRKRGGGGGRGANDYQRQTEQIEKRTASLQAQTAAQATVNPLIDDFGRTLETARAKQDLLTAAQQAGLTITPELTASIDALAGKYGAAYAEAQKLAKSQDDARRSAEELNEVARDTFGTFVSDLLHGKSAAEALTDAVGRLADRLLDIGLDSIFGTGGGGGSGLFGNLFSFLGSIFHKGGVVGSSAPSRAVSPSVFAGAPRMHSGGVAGGLRAGEVPAILQRGEVVLPKNTKIAAGGSETITVNLQTDQGLIADVADQRIKTHSGAIVHVAVTQAKNQVVPTMAAYQRDRAGGDYRG